MNCPMVISGENKSGEMGRQSTKEGREKVQSYFRGLREEGGGKGVQGGKERLSQKKRSVRWIRGGVTSSIVRPKKRGKKGTPESFMPTMLGGKNLGGERARIGRGRGKKKKSALLLRRSAAVPWGAQ